MVQERINAVCYGSGMTIPHGDFIGRPFVCERRRHVRDSLPLQKATDELMKTEEPTTSYGKTSGHPETTRLHKKIAEPSPAPYGSPAAGSPSGEA
jgi:hypothetical protein